MTYSGIVEGLSNELYHAHSAISSTGLKKLLTGTPAHLRSFLDSEDKLESEALLRGSVLHSMLLEPNTLNDTYIFERNYLKDKTRLAKNGGSKEQWDYLKEISEITGKPLVKFEIYDACRRMRDKVKANPYWPDIAKNSQKEISLFADIEGIPVKARYDAMLSNLVIDLKTSKDILTTANIQKTIIGLGYHFSAAMYIEIGRMLGLPVDGFVWIFVENKAPFSCRYVQADNEMLEIGRQEFYACLGKYKECLESDQWPGYSENVEVISMPAWYKNREYLFLGDTNESDS